MLGADACVLSAVPRFDVDAIFAEERQLVDTAIEKRRLEFATGRILARRALQQLGFALGPILRGEDRGPIWPRGAVGSITHTDQICAVAVARQATLGSIGIDIEKRRGMTPRMHRMILTARERAWVEAASSPVQALRALLIFSAKEAVYKCQRPITNQYLGFHDVELVVAGDLRSFRAEVLADPVRALGLTTIEGRLEHTEEFILATTTLPTGSPIRDGPITPGEEPRR